MRLLSLLSGCLALGLAAEAAGASPVASVRVAACVPALAAPERSATFEARARAVRGSERMQVRFALQVRQDERGGWRRVVAPGLDEWLSSDPGVRRYSFARTVENLGAPAAYRTLVRVRWLDAEGGVLKAARVVSAACRQPDLRPDLGAAHVAAADAPDAPGAGVRRYDVAVHNAGRTAAGGFAVGLRVGDRDLDPVALPGLAAGQTRVLAFTGPACAPGALLTVTVDAADAVEERDEEDNVLAVPCPPEPSG